MDRRKFLLSTAAGAGAFAFGPSRAEWNPAEAATDEAALEEMARAAANASPYPQFLTWDGGSGPNKAQWSGKLGLRWLRQGTGDWMDAAGALHGVLPYASAPVAAVGPINFEVKALVQRWLGSGQNRGFFLKSRQAWPFYFHGRESDTVAARPRLTITTSTGTFTPPCLSNAHWTPSSFYGQNSRKRFQVAQGGFLAIVQFDLAGITGTVQSATLTLHCDGFHTAGQLDIFEAWPPEFRDGAGSITPRQGIAQAFPLDKGLGGHPSVLFASDFTDLGTGLTKWQNKSMVPGTTQVADPETQSTYLRGLIPAGELFGCGLERDVVRGDANGQPTTVETELYARYYVYLEDSWGSTVDGNKMPGWDGRFGWWNPVGYWAPTTGNGGSRPTGLKKRNTTARRWEYEGASMRGHGGPKAGDGNPYDDLFWLASYIYHLDQAGNFGESTRWNNAVIGKRRWYCIEQYIKMNSITGPYDADGNGTAAADGVYRVWIDGVLAWERTNYRWRRHPEMGIQGFWLNWYHGGTQVSPANMHFRMNSVVISREYIGPMARRTGPAPLPAWVPPPGHLAVVTAANAWGDIDPCPTNTCGYRRGSGPEWDKIINDFSGGVYNPWWGQYGALMFHGGGHAATNDNSVALLDFNDLKFKLVADPSRGVTGIRPSDGPDYPGLNRVHGEYLSDGKPGSAHTYDGLAILPPSATGATHGSLVRPFATGLHNNVSINVFWAHKLDLTTRGVDTEASRAANAWTRWSVNGNHTFGNAGGCCAYDGKRNRLWWFGWPSNYRMRMLYLDCATRQQVSISYRGPEALFDIDPPIMHYLADRDLLLAIGPRNHVQQVAFFRPDAPTGWGKATLAQAIPVISPQATPWDYIPEMRKIVLFTPADPTAMYEIEVPADLNAPWPVARRPFQAGASIPKSGSVVGKRFAWSPALGCIVFKPAAGLPAHNQFYAYRPAATGPIAP